MAPTLIHVRLDTNTKPPESDMQRIDVLKSAMDVTVPASAANKNTEPPEP
jgi:hypothetical protein